MMVKTTAVKKDTMTVLFTAQLVCMIWEMASLHRACVISLGGRGQSRTQSTARTLEAAQPFDAVAK